MENNRYNNGSNPKLKLDLSNLIPKIHISKELLNKIVTSNDNNAKIITLQVNKLNSKNNSPINSTTVTPRNGQLSGCSSVSIKRRAKANKKTNINNTLQFDGIIPFHLLKVTTITSIAYLSGIIDLNLAFNLFPITRIHIPPCNQYKKKYKIPHIKIPGSILSLCFQGKTRGIVKNASPNFFKNVVGIEIAITSENISAKISPSSIQMCGIIDPLVDSNETINLIFQHLNYCQDMLDYIHENPEEAQKALEWVKEKTRGKKTIREVSEIKRISKIELNIITPVDDYEIDNPLNQFLENQFIENGLISASPSVDDLTFLDEKEIIKVEVNPINNQELIEIIAGLSEDLDPQIVIFLLTFIHDFPYYSDYCYKLDWIMSLESIFNEPLNVNHISEVMYNYNYSLGFRVDRHELCNVFSKQNDFISRYDDMGIYNVHSVTIELPYVREQTVYTNRKPKRGTRHTFLVYLSGSVTQSGPGGKLMEDAYYRFRQIIEDHKHILMIKDDEDPIISSLC